MKWSVAMIAMLGLAGCAGWGMMAPNDASTAAVRSALARQVLQPGGKPGTTQPEGMDGRAAQRGYQKFEKSFGEQGADSAGATSATSTTSKGTQ